MEKPKSNQSDTDENISDFQLIKERIAATQTNRIDFIRNLAVDEIWPLKLDATFIEHYILGDVIGVGSYAEVRECVDTRNLERLAIKIVNKDYLRRQALGALSNQFQEIRLLRRLHHRNVISMRECLFKNSKIYIVLDYGTFTLERLIREQEEKKLCPSIARCLFKQLIEGLDYLHSVGVVHRDIKPQNIVITTQGDLKIIDFGVSRILSMWSPDEENSSQEGSPLFQAPEVISSSAIYAGSKTDIWSSGVTLFLTLYGTYPFIDDSLLGLYEKILNDDFVLPTQEAASCSTIDGDCFLCQQTIIGDLFSRLLDKSCKSRPTAEEVLSHPWLRFCSPNLRLSHEHSEFIDLDQPQEEPASNKTRWSLRKDVYRSMSVLPYLHEHHFPKKRPETSQVNQGPSSATSTADDASDRNSERSTRDSTGPSSQSSELSSPNEILDENPVQWGTETQYNLLKVPQVRANRIRPNRRKRRHNSHKKQTKTSHRSSHATDEA